MKIFHLIFALCVPLLMVGSPGVAEDSQYRSLFNGKDLTGWDGSETLWKVEGDCIVGDSPGVKSNQFLCTKEEFGEFELKVEFRMRDGVGNSGIQFRTKRVPNSTEVSGYQADIGDKYWGCLYDESRRNKMLAQPSTEFVAALKKGDWHEYTIRAERDHVVLKLDDTVTVDYHEPDAEIARTGVVALQIHSGGPMKMEFRNIRIKSLGK